jgi:hypothetical protein
VRFVGTFVASPDFARRHCCVGRESDTTPAPGEAGHVCEPNETVDYRPHKLPI